MQQRFLAPVHLVITALLWSLGGVLIKSIDWPPMAIAAGRSIALIPVLLACARGQRFTFSPAQVGGAIAYAATVALFVFATRMTTAANAIFLQYTAPIYVAIIGRWYLDERPLPRSEEHTSELQSQSNLVCRLLLEKKKYTRSTQMNRRALMSGMISSATNDIHLSVLPTPTSLYLSRDHHVTPVLFSTSPVDLRAPI